MKIVYIANIRMPTEKAHGIQIMKMCEAFSLIGSNLDLIIPWRFNKIKEGAFNFYGVKKNFKIKKLFSLDLIPLRIPRLGFWIQSLTFSVSVFFYLFFKKTDIIYSRDSFSLYLLSFFKKNLICEIHAFPNNFILHKRVFKKSKAIIVITNKLKELLIKKGIDENKILVASDGVDINEFDIKESQKECRKKLNLPLDKKIIGYVGQLRTMGMEKGIKNLIEALSILIRDNQFVILCLVGGDKSDIIEYKKIVKKMNLTERVFFIGQVKHQSIPVFLKSFDVLTMPFPNNEHYKYYMSPLKLFEYMASQKPIIASDLLSIREILNENNAILINSDDSEDLAKGINLSLKNKDFSDKISLQAYQDVQEYTWQKRTKKIVNFIK